MTRRAVVSGVLVVLFAVGVTMGCGCVPTPTPGPTATPEPTQTPEPTATPEEIGELPGTFQYSMEFSDSEGITVTMDVWAKGVKSRSDYTANNIAMKYSRGGGSDPSAAYALWFTENYYGDTSEGTILAAMQVACPGASITGHETVAGQSTTKFTCTLEGITTHYWITDDGWLVKAEVSQDGYTATYQFTDIILNQPISDDMFDINVVAPGATVMDMTGI